MTANIAGAIPSEEAAGYIAYKIIAEGVKCAGTVEELNGWAIVVIGGDQTITKLELTGVKADTAAIAGVIAVAIGRVGGDGDVVEGQRFGV